MTRTLADAAPADRRIPPGHLWARLPAVLLVVSAVSLAASALLADGRHGWSFAWLAGFLYAASMGLGALFFVLLQHASKAGWSVVVRRVAENLAAPLPLLALLFVPLWFLRFELYGHWMDGERLGADPLLAGKQAFLDERFWLARSAVYLLLWALMGIVFFRRSVAQDRAVDESRARAATRSLQNLSYPAIALFGFSITFAAIDWAMTLDPHWYSTMWGVWYFSGTILCGFALLGLTVLLMRRSGLLVGLVTPEHLHDIGKLVFAFTVFWAYISFSQFLLIWYASIPEETTWFHLRMGDGNPWELVGIGLMLGHFALPFLFLLPRSVKRNPRALLAACGWMLAVHFVDICYAVLPADARSLGTITASSFLVALGLACLMWGTGLALMCRHALVPIRDPRLPESLGERRAR